MKRIETSKGKFVITDKYSSYIYRGVYCPECGEYMPMTGTAHCLVCHAATDYGEFHDDDIEFDYEGFEKDCKVVWTRICKLSEITEEQANDIVQSSLHTGLFAHYVKDTEVNIFCYTKAKDSLNTLLESYDIEITPNTYIFKI
ncbi:hypothetical protein [Empedobacter brevis]|uniref:hypothetical protein n=1 Tax=Empedobacter brevis TaxID=247 RepID=UPI00333F05F9